MASNLSFIRLHETATLMPAESGWQLPANQSYHFNWCPASLSPDAPPTPRSLISSPCCRIWSHFTPLAPHAGNFRLAFLSGGSLATSLFTAVGLAWFNARYVLHRLKRLQHTRSFAVSTCTLWETDPFGICFFNKSGGLNGSRGQVMATKKSEIQLSLRH